MKKKTALGMTIDYDKDQVYWLVKKLNGDSLLYRTNIDSSSVPWINQIASSARGRLIKSLYFSRPWNQIFLFDFCQFFI